MRLLRIISIFAIRNTTDINTLNHTDMKKALLFAVSILFAAAVTARDVVFDFTSNLTGYDTTYIQQDPITITLDGVTFLAEKNNGTTNPRLDNNMFRFYAKSKITLSADYPIVKVVFDRNSSATGTMSDATPDSGAMNGEEWTGSATSVSFVTSVQVRLNKMTVTIADDGVIPVDTTFEYPGDSVQPQSEPIQEEIGFRVTNNDLGYQIHDMNLIQNMSNIYLDEVDTVSHKYSIVVPTGGVEGSFTMGGIRFSYTNSADSVIAFKTYQTYIQPHGKGRTISIPTMPGDEVRITIYENGTGESWTGMLVTGATVSTVNLYSGDNYLTATGTNMEIISTDTAGNGIKPKISAIELIRHNQSTDTVAGQEMQYMTCAEAQAACQQLPQGSYGTDTVVVTGYITDTDGKISRNQQCFWMDDVKGTAKTLQGYWCNMPAGETTALVVGDKIELKGVLYNYQGSSEIKNGYVTILERETNVYVPQVVSMTCAEALSICLQMAGGDDVFQDSVLITGYVTATNETDINTYHNQTFWMDDMKGTGQTIQVYRGMLPDGETRALVVGDKVQVKGKLQYYRASSSSSDDGIPEVYGGSVTILERAQADTVITIDFPNTALLQRLYNATDSVVFCCHFEGPVCNDIVMVGTYKLESDSATWVSNPQQLTHMIPVPGYDGWYVAVLPLKDGWLSAKPVALNNDGMFYWENQTGDIESWEYVAGNQCSVDYVGYAGESELYFSSPGVYVYQSLYWRNHVNPCEEVQTHNYHITLLAPECGGFRPAITGTFNNWSAGEVMNRVAAGVYTYIITDKEGHEFKFREATDTDWSNEIVLYDAEYDLWYRPYNIILGTDTTIVVDFSQGTWILCDNAGSTKGKLIWPVLLDDATLSHSMSRVVNDFRAGQAENSLYVWENTYAAGQGGGLNFSGYSEEYLSLVVTDQGWSGAGFYAGGTAEWQGADRLRRWILTNPDKFFLHLAVKSSDSRSHSFSVLSNDTSAGFTLGQTPGYDRPVIGDFARDGEWHEFDIPMAQFVNALTNYAIDAPDNVFSIMSEGIQGTEISLDAVYFYSTADVNELNAPAVRIITTSEVSLDEYSVSPLYSDQDELTILAEGNATVAVSSGYGLFFNGEEVTIASVDTAMFVLNAPWPIMGNGDNVLVITGNLVLISVETEGGASSIAARQRVAKDVVPGTVRNPAISYFRDVQVAPDKKLCEVWYTEDDGTTRKGDPTRASYHAAEQAYGEVDIDTQSFVPATSLVFADENFYTDYIDGKIDIENSLMLPDASRQEVRKVVHNGNVYIIRDGQVFTILGTQVR